MKIVYIENVRMPSERAHAYQIVQTCANWGRLGHHVILVTPERTRGQNIFSYFHLPSNLFQHVALRTADPLSWRWFFLKRIAYFFQRFFFLRAVRASVRTESADVWYTRDVAMVEALGSPAKSFVLELHDSPERLKKRWNKINLFISRVVVITKNMREPLIALGVHPDKIFVAPDGFDPDEMRNLPDREAVRQSLNIPREAIVCLYLGSLYPWKGVDLVVQTWHRLPSNAYLFIVGGPAQDQLRLKRLVSHEDAERVHFFDQMPHEQAIRFLSAADLGLLTSSPHDAHGRLYTSPLKLFEYLAAGLPILASDVPSSRELLTEDVARFYEPTSDGFVSALRMIIEHPSWIDLARSRAKAFVQPYTWKSRSRSIAEWLEA
ncbi:MAG TPA: glycosyltransferase [Patescibacteria group bacterium]|nr:glycosyltransferase [Patescibacteria group bacterium]